jgi:hypothetical protein
MDEFFGKSHSFWIEIIIKESNLQKEIRIYSKKKGEPFPVLLYVGIPNQLVVSLIKSAKSFLNFWRDGIWV